MAKTVKYGQVEGKSKKAVEYGIRKPSDEFDRRPNKGDAAVTYVKGK